MEIENECGTRTRFGQTPEPLDKDYAYAHPLRLESRVPGHRSVLRASWRTLWRSTMPARSRAPALQHGPASCWARRSADNRTIRASDNHLSVGRVRS